MNVGFLSTIAAFLFFPAVALAFSWEECKKLQSDTQGKGLFTQLSTGMSEQITSSAQFSTSTGSCAMIGQTRSARAAFVARNFAELRKDASQGGGSYLAAYSQLAGCDASGASVLARQVQAQFPEIFYGRSITSEEYAFLALENLLKSAPCSVL